MRSLTPCLKPLPARAGSAARVLAVVVAPDEPVDGTHRGIERSPGMNGTSTSPRVSTIISPQTRASALSEVENGGSGTRTCRATSRAVPGSSRSRSSCPTGRRRDAAAAPGPPGRRRRTSSSSERVVVAACRSCPRRSVRPRVRRCWASAQEARGQHRNRPVVAGRDLAAGRRPVPWPARRRRSLAQAVLLVGGRARSSGPAPLASAGSPLTPAQRGEDEVLRRSRPGSAPRPTAAARAGRASARRSGCVVRRAVRRARASCRPARRRRSRRRRSVPLLAQSARVIAFSSGEENTAARTTVSSAPRPAR